MVASYYDNPYISLKGESDGYSVGRSNDMTIIRLNHGSTSMMMSMNDDEVYRLIRLLEASMDQADE